MGRQAIRLHFPDRGVAQPGRALALGARSRWFESGHPDLLNRTFALATIAALSFGSAAGSQQVTQCHGQQGFRGTIARIDSAQAKRMTGVSWRAGCPVHLRDLRLLTLSHWGFDGKMRTGRLIVHEDVARPMLGVFEPPRRFPIRKLVPVDAYGAGDFRSIEADNTSAFNCRYVEGTAGGPSTRTGARSTSIRSRTRACREDARHTARASRTSTEVVGDRGWRTRAGPSCARSIGWGWGGRWTSVQDYQHFSASGR